MSREIKFRGWDTRKNVMYSAEEMAQDQLTLSVDGRGFINVHGSSTKLSTFPTHIIPMQYTGLKDKNGVEIWEEDGVRGRCTVQKHRMYNPFVGIVKWNEQYAQFYIAGKDGDGDLIAPPFDIVVLAELEVIGDILTKPELLEDK